MRGGATQIVAVEGAPVAHAPGALDQTFGLQLVGDAGDVAARHHHAARQLVHLQPVRVALQLRHQVEPGQRGFKLRAQLGAHLLFDQLRQRQHAQPEPQGLRMLDVASCFHVL